MRNKKISKDIIIIFLLSIYIITPLYFEIFSISAMNIIATIIVIISLRLDRIFKIKLIKYKMIYLCVIIWFIITSISLLFNQSATEIIFRFLRCILLFLAINEMCKNKDKFLNIIHALVVTGGIISIFGIIEEVTHFNIFSLLLHEGETLNYNPLRFGILRILSFSAQTISYGVYLMFVLALCVYIMQFGDKKKQKVYRIIYFLLWVNLLLTLSRSIIMCTIISQILLLFLQGKKEFIKNALKIIVILIIGLGIGSFIFPKIKESVEMIIYMLLAIFDEKYIGLISSSFGGDNLNALGNRVDLYNWVSSSMGKKWIWGNGINAKFHFPYLETNGIFTWTQYKDSIEVQYLNILYRYGITGLVASILVYISTLYTCLVGKFKKSLWENKIGFNAVCFVVLCAYYINFFAVNQSSDQNIFYTIIMLLIIYNSKKIRLC